jgi:predicted amidophosphoribosyltransferase
MKSLAACFEESPSSQALLALPGKAIAPFIVLQLETLRWPIPDYVIPSPGDWFSQGSDRWAIRKEIAEAVAHLFNTTYSPCLTLNRYLLPIVYRSLESQKTASSREVVSLHSPSLIINARILLIHDTFISGNALSTAAKALMHHGALGVWGISLISG